jgi:hypothetical protein
MELKTQTKLWKYAAWTLPFIALAAITFVYFLGYDNLVAKFIVITCTAFFGISVFWWWWALDKLTKLMEDRFALQKRFDDIYNEFRKIKKDLN